MPPRAQRALLGALVCLAALFVIGLVTFSQTGRSLDMSAMRGFMHLERQPAEPLASMFVRLGGTGPALVWCAVLVAIAMHRGRPRLAGLIVFVAASSAITTGILKQLASQPRSCNCADLPMSATAWPSGHATMAMALILGAILVTPARWRPTVAVAGGAIAIAFAFALMIIGWHYPSDVLAGVLVPTLWALIGLAVMWTADARWPERAGREAAIRVGAAIAPIAAGVLIAGLALTAVVLARPESVEAYGEAYPAAVAAGALIAATAGGVAAAFALAIRR